MTDPGTGALGPEVLVELRPRAGSGALLGQLERGLREAVRCGRLAAGARMPSSRVLASDLGVSRRLVTDAYGQLVAERYLVSRPGAGTFVAGAARPAGTIPPLPAPRPPAFDFFPGAPDLAGFPRRAWLHAVRDVLRTLPDAALGYPDPRGAPELREALAESLARSRGVVADPGAIVVCAGVTQALALIGSVLAARGTRRVVVEDPGLATHRLTLERAGAEVLPVAVDESGLDLSAPGARDAAAVLVTPAHQQPTGVALGPERRAALLDWAAQGGLVIEDDYDAEFRYDRAPLGALQGLAPDRVVYLGSVSKTLAPALRLGWLVLPSAWVEEVALAKLAADSGNPVLDQLALAALLSSGEYDRHLRQARRRCRARRDALAAALARHLPGAELRGLAAGLHGVVRLERPVDPHALVEAARRESVMVYPLDWSYAEPPPQPTGALVLGYADLAEAAIGEGVRRLARALATVDGPLPRGALG